MKIDECTPEDVHTVGGGEFPPCVGLTSCALPEAQSNANIESSQTGVSTRSVHILSKSKVQKRKKFLIGMLYALPMVERKGIRLYDSQRHHGFLSYHRGCETYKGKRKIVIESRLPNIFFAYGTEEQLKTFVYDNVNLPFLRFYYRHVHEGARITKRPLVVPEYQIESLKIICASEAEDIILVPSDVEKFKAGQTVRVIEGVFKGVIGKVARFQGQQRIGIVIDGL